MDHRLFAALPLLLAAWAGPAAAAETACPKPFTAKLHSDGEVSEAMCDGSMTRIRMNKDHVLISDMKSGKTLIVLENTREYVEYVPTKEELEEQEKLQLEPCADQKKLAQDHKGVTCRKTGSATVGGRSTERYETRGGGVEPIIEFYDPDLKAVIKEQKGAKVVFEMSDVRIGPVPPAQFRVPAGYRKITFDQYIERAMKAAQEEEKRGRKK